MIETNSILKDAIAYQKAGFAVVITYRYPFTYFDKKEKKQITLPAKSPILEMGSWIKLRDNRLTEEELIKYLNVDKYNIGILGGDIKDSFFVVLLDFDMRDYYKAFAEDNLKLLSEMYIEKTGKGYHVIFIIKEPIDQKSFDKYCDGSKT